MMNLAPMFGGWSRRQRLAAGLIAGLVLMWSATITIASLYQATVTHDILLFGAAIGFTVGSVLVLAAIVLEESTN